MYSSNLSDQGIQNLGIVELEHAVGYNGRFQNTVHHIPNSKDSYVYSIGGLVVIEDLNDKHNQRFLRGHDMEISAIAIGSSGCLSLLKKNTDFLFLGRYIATGQVGTIHAKIDDAPVRNKI